MSEGFDLVSGGTDNHLMLIDLTRMGITGKDAEAALGKANITVNKNTIPFETRSPFVTSGVRIGTPAVTTRGMGVAEMKIIASSIGEVLKNITNESVIQKVNRQVAELCSGFPLFKE
jgi:glycine hydroxymethyltransferase